MTEALEHDDLAQIKRGLETILAKSAGVDSG
jgi:hypothetical protein